MSLPKMCAIVSDITRTEDTESHQGRVCLKDMDLPPTFKDDFHVFGYLSEREDVKKDKIACSLGGTESEKQIIARIF